jgi:hypothetical protein
MCIPPFIRPALICTAAAAAACTSVAANEPFDNDLGWLEGCWALGDAETEEHWIDAGHGLLFGHSVTIRDGSLVTFEDLRIEPGATGPVYVAAPGGRSPVQFQYVESGASAIVFENPDHDFPQRIAYRRSGDLLTATISTLDRSRQIAIPMLACGQGANDPHPNPLPAP